MTKSHMPPVPPANRTDKGPETAQATPAERAAADTSIKKGPPDNLEQQARQGNTKQNTTHQGYQQDR